MRSVPVMNSVTTDITGNKQPCIRKPYCAIPANQHLLALSLKKKLEDKGKTMICVLYALQLTKRNILDQTTLNGEEISL